MDENDTPTADSQCRWLGYELHDGLLQWIVGARLHLDALTATNLPLDANQLRHLAEVSHCVQLAAEEGRALIGFLENQAAAGLVDVRQEISNFLSTVRRASDADPLVVKLAPAEKDWPLLPPQMAWNLLRIAQQAVLNGVQHAQATTIEVQLDWHDADTLLLRIADNGIGFDEHRASAPQDGQSHFGLSSMRHRAGLLKARLEIESSPGAGCVIRLTMPSPATGP